jgi:hypothetical protein
VTGFLAFGERVNVDAALSQAQRGFQRFHHPRARSRADAYPVLEHFDQVALLGVGAEVALLLQQLQDLRPGKILRHRDRESDGEPRVARGARARGEIGADRLRRVARDPAPAAPAVEARRAREEQLQVVVQLRHRPDGGARGAHRVGLIYGDRRRDALDRVHLRLVHAVEELPRVGAEGLDVAALPFGVERVEDER